MQKDIEMISIPLNVFSNDAYCVKISNFYFQFYYGKTSKEDPKNFQVRKNRFSDVIGNSLMTIAMRS